MSVKILYFGFRASDFEFCSIISPKAIPATCFLKGTPASIKASEDEQVVAMEEEPLEESVSATIRIAYGNSSFEGISARSAFAAKAPCPISLRPGPRDLPVSPTEKFGKL